MDDPIIDYQNHYEWEAYPEGMPIRNEKLRMRSERLKMVFKEGNEGALYDALIYSFAYGDTWDRDMVLVPRWALTAAAYCVAHHLAFVQKKGNHRYSKDLEIYPQFEEHFRRYQEVHYLLSCKEYSTGKAFEEVADKFQVSANTIKDSYYKIKNMENAGAKLLEFFHEFSADDLSESDSIFETYNRKEKQIATLQERAIPETDEEKIELLDRLFKTCFKFS